MGDGRVFSFYHTRENGICQRVWERGRWSGALSVAVDARPGFEAAQLGGRFFILYQDREGYARMVSSAGDGGYVIENLPLGWVFGNCALIPSKRGLRLFFEEKAHDRPNILSVLKRGGAWEGVVDIDNHSGGFCSQVIADDHGVLFYQRTGPDASFGYREFTADREGEYHPVNIQPVYGYSCLTTADSVHFLYSVRTMMGYRLCYRKLCGTGLTASVTVHEGQRQDNCLIFIAGERIYACFTNAGQPFVCESDNEGRSFRAAVRYQRKFCQFPMKAGFLSAECDPGKL
ncbi:MAG: hypothetical protein LBS19_15495, partial [Clostridiales bacterium]|nr:hypothetical protein [Clostridiales bacterium]